MIGEGTIEVEQGRMSINNVGMGSGAEGIDEVVEDERHERLRHPVGDGRR